MPKSQPSDTKRWKYGELTIDDFLDAAANIVRSKGIDALTMRSLARELSISSMSAYHYVTDKKHLLKLLIDRMLIPVHVPPGDNWRERIRACYISSYENCTKYPGLMVESHQYYGVGEGARIAGEVMSVLKDAGFDEQSVNAWVIAVTNYQMGFIQWEWILRKSDKGIRPKRFIGHFTRGLEILLDGLEFQKSDA